MTDELKNFRCVLHGSFRKSFDEIKKVRDIFTQAGIEVLAPAISDIKTIENGFAMLESDKEKDQRMIELLYLHNLKRLGVNGFSYFVNPDGYIGKSASYELGIAQISNVKCFFAQKPADHPVYAHNNSIWKAQDLAEYILKYKKIPEPKIKRNEQAIHKLWEGLMVPGSVVAVGGIIEYEPMSPKKAKEILLVKTHKWENKYSVVGGKARRNERLEDALKREVREETGLKARIGRHICTFDEIKNSQYYLPGIQHIFIDKVVKVESKKVFLNDEAEDFIWLPANTALKELPIEANARYTIELYAKSQAKNNSF